MPGVADYEELLGSCPSHIPAAVCAAGGWRLLHATEPLKNIIHLERGRPQADALEAWFASGSLENLAPESASSGDILFQQPDGQAWLVCWWLAGDYRLVALHALPLEKLNLAVEHTLEEVDRILDFIHDGIWVIDSNGITRRINRAMERIAGIRSEEVVGRHVSEPLHEGRFKTCVTLKALQTKRTVTLFDDYSNGKRCLNTSTPVFDSSGNVWRVIAAIRDITELDSLQERLSNLEVEAMAYRLRVQGLESQSHNGLMGQSPSLQRVMQDVRKAAQTDAVTLILGETGTGKTLAAKTIHEMSSRAEKPFVTVNCGAIPASLMESELFGYEKGAFTGAAKNGKPGMIELAAGGTLLLDEIGELSLPMQAKLLHMLDGQTVYRVGGTRPLHICARILAATNRELEKMVASGHFREDLFYRLRVLCISMPPLRERRDDILRLAWHFLRKINTANGMKKTLDTSAERFFLAYAWPGNVRELESVIQSLATLCEHERITATDLPTYMRPDTPATSHPRKRTGNLNEAVASLEKDMLAEALAECGSSYKAARRLGISQSSVVRKARKYGLRLNNEPPAAQLPDYPPQNGSQDMGTVM